MTNKVLVVSEIYPTEGRAKCVVLEIASGLSDNLRKEEK